MSWIFPTLGWFSEIFVCGSIHYRFFNIPYTFEKNEYSVLRILIYSYLTMFYLFLIYFKFLRFVLIFYFGYGFINFFCIVILKIHLKAVLQIDIRGSRIFYIFGGLEVFYQYKISFFFLSINFALGRLSADNNIATYTFFL